MTHSTVLIKDQVQMFPLPEDARFPAGVRRVEVRVIGNDRIISPIESSWESFFRDGKTVSEDFLEDRGSQHQSPREEF